MTDADAMKIVGLLVAAFRSPAWPPETVRLYVQCLLDLDAAVTQAVVLDLIKSRTDDRAPTIGTVRQAVAARLAAHNGTAALEPEQAWRFVLECFTRVGSYSDFPGTYPLVKRVVDGLGWRELCLSENMIADRAHFLRLYTERLRRHRASVAAQLGAVLPPSIDLRRIGHGPQPALTRSDDDSTLQ